MSKYLTYFHTLKYMKFTQIKYRLWYMIRGKYRKATKFKYSLVKPSNVKTLKLEKSIDSYESYVDGKFIFLNIEHKFLDSIDWNIQKHGKLWVYNLNYFEYLNQKDMDRDIGLRLVNDFVKNIEKAKDGLEPFPNSLRGINWIKFFSYHKIKDKNIDDALYAQYYILLDTLEYHILGNHLLENGFSLLFGAYYFNDALLLKKAKEIVSSELEEEILLDGAHYELSPMYHQLMLFRLLDCINLIKNNTQFEDEKFLSMLEEKATIMFSYLKQISYKDGSIPHFNDSADGIAPTTNKLLEYADRLNIDTTKKVALKECGYRVFNTQDYELKIDVGEIGPSYIPGHAHSDTFNFELRVDGKPFIVDTGISTYNSNERRLIERQTDSHNTVQIDGIEQSKVWSSFRVAQRASIVDFQEDKHSVKASHDGYKELGITHQREFQADEKNITIKDKIISQGDSEHTCIAYVHFHPDIKEIRVEKEKIVTKYATFSIKGSKNLQLDDFTFANGFNRLEKAKVLKITFSRELLMNIVLI